MLILDWLAAEIMQCMKQMGNMNGIDQMSSQLHSLLEHVKNARNCPENVAVILLIQNAVTGFLNSDTLVTDVTLIRMYRDCYLLVLKELQNFLIYGPHRTRREVTRCVVQHHGENKYNLKLVDVLVSFNLINMAQYDMGLVQLMEDGLNSMAVTFAMNLVQWYCIDRGIQSLVSVTDLSSTIKALTLIAANPNQEPDGLTRLIENLHQINGKFGVLDEVHGDPTAVMQSSISQALRIDDPPGLYGKTKILLSKWVNMLQSLTADRKSGLAFAAFLRQADQLCILQTDDMITRFFRLCTEMCVDIGNSALCQQFLSSINIVPNCYFTWDAYTHLLALLVKHSGGITNTATKINLLNKVLGIVAGVLLRDHHVIQTTFHQLPYYRIFIMLFVELNAADPILENINFQVLTTFCNLLNVLKPTDAPGFASAWLNLMSDKVFIDRMLVYSSEKKIWEMYAQLLIDLFKFMSPFLTNACIENQGLVMHMNTLKLLQVLLHDFPDFLCEYHHEFCDAMSPHCIEMRNLILRASPRNMPVPDPLTLDLKVDMLPEIAHPPRSSTSFANMIETVPFKKDLDSYLKKGSPATFLSMLVRNLKSDELFSYNVPLINALVLYVGTQAIDCTNSKGLTPSMSTITNSKHTDFFDNLVHGLDSTGRYLFLTAILNQLTYPNSHTHYFSCLLPYLFNGAIKEEIHEHITILVLERLANNCLYPWGLLITVIELLKNPIFEFWSRDYIHSLPEVEKLFESVAQLHEAQESNSTMHKQMSALSKSNPVNQEELNPTTHEPESDEIHGELNPTTHEVS